MFSSWIEVIESVGPHDLKKMPVSFNQRDGGGVDAKGPNGTLGPKNLEKKHLDRTAV